MQTGSYDIQVLEKTSSSVVSSDRSSCNDDGLLYIRQRKRQLFQIFTQSIDAIYVTSVTLSRLNSINAIDVTRYLEIFWGYFEDI